MWAEVIVRTRRDLPNNLRDALAVHFTARVEVRRAIDATTWHGNYDWEDQVVHSHLSNSLVFLIFSPEVRTLKIHVESAFLKSDIRALRGSVEEIERHITQFLNHNKNGAQQTRVAIYSEDNHFQTGKKLTWLGKLGEATRESLLVKLYIPIATYVASLLMNYEPGRAAFNVLAALVALILWILIDASFIRPSFRYE